METFFGIAFAFGIVGFIFWFILKGLNKISNKQAKANTDNHFILTYMNKCADSKIKEEITNSLNDEINKLPIPVFLSENYLFFKKMHGIEYVPLSSIVWLYAKNTTYKTNIGNYMGEYHCLVVKLDGNITKTIGIGTENSSYIVKKISEKCLWATVGYSEQLAKDMKKNFLYYQSEKDTKYKKFISNNYN